LPNIGKAWEEFNPGTAWDKATERLPNMDEAWKDFADFSKESIRGAANKFHAKCPLWVVIFILVCLGIFFILVCLRIFFPFVLSTVGFGDKVVVKGFSSL
jgi:hypothetical protein